MRRSLMLERMLGSKFDAVKIESNVPVGIEHKTVKYNGTIDTERAFDGIGTLCMTSLPILAADKDQEKKDNDKGTPGFYSLFGC